MILGYFTNKPLRLDPRFLGRFSGFICVAAKISAQKLFLVAAIYEHLVGGLVKTLYTIVTNTSVSKLCAREAPACADSFLQLA